MIISYLLQIIEINSILYLLAIVNTYLQQQLAIVNTYCYIIIKIK